MGLPDAETSLSDSLAFWEKELDFKLLERSTVEVGGVTAEQVVYFYRCIVLLTRALACWRKKQNRSLLPKYALTTLVSYGV